MVFNTFLMINFFKFVEILLLSEILVKIKMNRILLILQIDVDKLMVFKYHMIKII